MGWALQVESRVVRSLIYWRVVAILSSTLSGYECRGLLCSPPRGVAQARTFMLPNWADVGLKFDPEAGGRWRNVHL